MSFKWQSAKVVGLCLVQQLLTHAIYVTGPFSLVWKLLYKYYIYTLKQEAVTIIFYISTIFCA
jgi:hypothetical protein